MGHGEGGILKLHEFFVQIFHTGIFFGEIPRMIFFLLGTSLEGQCMGLETVHDFFSRNFPLHEFFFFYFALPMHSHHFTNGPYLINGHTDTGVSSTD